VSYADVRVISCLLQTKGWWGTFSRWYMLCSEMDRHPRYRGGHRSIAPPRWRNGKLNYFEVDFDMPCKIDSLCAYRGVGQHPCPTCPQATVKPLMVPPGGTILFE